MESQIERGVNKKLIAFDTEQKNITYRVQNKKFRFSDPEEKVRAEAYVSLVLDYGYPPEQIDIEFTVPHRVPNIYADLVVFADRSLKTPLIVVECKREEASEGELEQAIEQGFGTTKDDIGFNLAHIKQLRVKDTNGLRQDIKKQIEVFYGLSAETA